MTETLSTQFERRFRALLNKYNLEEKLNTDKETKTHLADTKNWLDESGDVGIMLPNLMRAPVHILEKIR